MSFTIALYANQSPANALDKDIVYLAGAIGVLKDNTSIIDPVVIVESQWSAGMISNINYAVVEEFGRSYFINNIVSIRNGLWELHMHVDVLSTYKEKIRQQKAIVKRSQNLPSMKFDDGWFSCYQNPIIEVHQFSAEHPFDDEQYVLVVGGGIGSSQS